MCIFCGHGSGFDANLKQSVVLLTPGACVPCTSPGSDGRLRSGFRGLEALEGLVQTEKTERGVGKGFEAMRCLPAVQAPRPGDSWVEEFLHWEDTLAYSLQYMGTIYHSQCWKHAE
jgi:hypothetical protein